jgi:colanic acid biosynthesis glycosyl transferase WcaI
MKILIIGLNYAPELTGVGKYTSEMAQWLAARGHELHVVTAPPYYPNWRVSGGYSAWRYRRERLAGVEVWRCPLYVPKNPSRLKRLVHLASFALFSIPPLCRHIFWRPDIILVICPTILCAPAGWLAAKLSRSKCWLHVQDFEMDLASNLRLFAMGQLAAAVECWLMQRFDCVSSISQNMVRRLIDKGIDLNVTFLFTNWVDTQIVRPSPEAGQRFRAERGIGKEKYLLLYAGNMGRKQGLEIILDAATRLSGDPDILFCLVGDGAARPEIERKACQMNLSNVRFYPLAPADKLSDMLSAADIHLVVQRRGAADWVLPSKFITILAAGGTAILTADNTTELGRLVAERPDIAYLIEPENAEQLQQTILLAKSMKSESRGFNKTARDYAQSKFEKSIILENFHKKLTGLVANR